MFETELKAIKSDLEMLKEQRLESKKIRDRELRKPIMFKIHEIKLILKEIETAILELLDTERLFPDFSSGQKKDQANKLMYNLAHSVEQYIYHYETNEIGLSETVTKEIEETPGDVERIRYDKKRLQEVERLEINMIEDFRVLLKKLENLLKDHDKDNKDENKRVKKLLHNLRKMSKQFKLILDLSKLEVRLAGSLK